MAVVDLSVIIVSWNVADLLVASLASIQKITQPHASGQLRLFGPSESRATLEVLVVDNASGDDSVTRVRDEYPWVQLIESDHNLGFTGGNNAGYAQSRGDFVYFLNPDTEIVADAVGFDSLWLLFRSVADDPSVGLAGPCLRYGDGTLQSSRRRFPTRATGFVESTWLGQALPVNPWARRYQMDDWPSAFPHDVDWLVGAAMLARRSALEEIRTEGAIGPFDEAFFMYSEEIDLCKRLKDAGWRILYYPDAVVLHHEGRSSEQVVAARHVRFNTSKIRYARKHSGTTYSDLLRRFLLMEYRVQLWQERAKLLLGSKPELRRDRITAYQQVLDSDLKP